MMNAVMVITHVLLMLPAIILMVDITVHVTRDMKEMVSLVLVSLMMLNVTIFSVSKRYLYIHHSFIPGYNTAYAYTI